MKTTTADVAALHSPNAAQPLEWNGTDASIAPAQKTQSTMNAAGGLISSASDLAKLLQELTGSRGHVITEDISRQLFAKEAEVKKGIAFIQRNAYGLGWYIGGLEGRPLIHHFGSFVGAHVHLSFSPEDHIGVAVLANEDTPMVHAIAADIYSLLRTGKPDNKVEAIQAMALRFAEKMKQQAAAKPKAEPMSADWAGRYENPVFGEAEITPEGMLTVGCVHAPMQIQASGFAVVLGDDHLAGAVHLDRDEPRLELVVEGRSLEFVRQRRR